MHNQIISLQSFKAESPHAACGEVRYQHKSVLRLPEVIRRTGLSRSTIYNKLDKNSPNYDPSFPRQAKLGGRAVAWDEEELDFWIRSQLSARHH